MPNHFTGQKPEISAEQRDEPQRWVRRPKTSQALALGARIILASEGGFSDMAIAVQLGTTRETVGKWRRRFLQRGCDGLLDEARPGAPRQIRDEDVERALTLTLESCGPQKTRITDHSCWGSDENSCRTRRKPRVMVQPVQYRLSHDRSARAQGMPMRPQRRRHRTALPRSNGHHDLIWKTTSDSFCFFTCTLSSLQYSKCCTIPPEPETM